MLRSTGPPPGQPWSDVVAAGFFGGGGRSPLATLTWIMMSKTQMPAMVMVIRVNVSPALDPNGLDPPAPPKAPISPPPFPRWIRMVRISSRPRTMMTKFRMCEPTLTLLVNTGELRGGTAAPARPCGCRGRGSIGFPNRPGTPVGRDRRHETPEMGFLVRRVSCLQG